jgi:hypothetical protein
MEKAQKKISFFRKIQLNLTLQKKMHPEIEKLIDLALADGQITEKERNVIFIKASDFGINQDEVEMIIDAKKHLKEKETIGSQIKCPSCGKRISGLAKTCSCGYVFNTGSIQESKSLESAIETLENLIIHVRGLSSSTSKEVIESLIARVEKEIRYIKTRYSENDEVRKLLSELEVISDKYINKIVNKSKKRKIIYFSITLIIISLFVLLYVKGSTIMSKKESELNNFKVKLDSIVNPKMKENIKQLSSLYKTWDNFKSQFFESYPETGSGWVKYYMNRYRLNEKLSYSIANNQFNLIQKRFKSPIDFILYDENKNYRILESTIKNDSIYILTFMSNFQWNLKKEIDAKIDLLTYSYLADELRNLNNSDSVSRLPLVDWENGGTEYVSKIQCGFIEGQGYLNAIKQDKGFNNEIAEKYCYCRIEYYKKRFAKPIDYYIFIDFDSNPNKKKLDVDNKNNSNVCLNKVNGNKN